ncbi:MAG: TfoX/Sxy family protein [Steroidobacteraceae bacterium]
MASSIEMIHYICDQAGLGKRLVYRKMFGEYALYVDDKVIALLCNDQLFLKPTAEGKAHLGEVVLAPPYPGAKDHFLLAALLDDPDALRDALLITAGALPAPKPKRPRPKAGKPRKS